ncbi:hypothetical protein KM043_013347 [Ampulex compressa]|nr:hypothetical protein KM043_013347 [Ampulex compressa]
MGSIFLERLVSLLLGHQLIEPAACVRQQRTLGLLRPSLKQFLLHRYLSAARILALFGYRGTVTIGIFAVWIKVLLRKGNRVSMSEEKFYTPIKIRAHSKGAALSTNDSTEKPAYSPSPSTLTAVYPHH